MDEVAFNQSRNCNDTLEYRREELVNITRDLQLAKEFLETSKIFERIDEKKDIRVAKEGLYNGTYDDEQEQLKYLKREWALLERLKRRLDIINVELNYKEMLDKNQASKILMEQAFVVVNASQHKFDELIKTKENQEEGIHNNTKELNELMGKIDEANQAYDKQDPKEREKSFSIAY